jgi:hypothetical protein
MPTSDTIEAPLSRERSYLLYARALLALAGLVTAAFVWSAYQQFSHHCRELGCIGLIVYPPAGVGCGLALVPSLWLIPGLGRRWFWRSKIVRIGAWVLGCCGLALALFVVIMDR